MLQSPSVAGVSLACLKCKRVSEASRVREAENGGVEAGVGLYRTSQESGFLF